MKKYFLLLISFPFIGFAQTYTVIQQPTYGLDPTYTPTTYTVKQTAPARPSNPIGDAMNQIQQDMFTNRALRVAEQTVINQKEIEDERRQQANLENTRLQELERKRNQEEERKEEERDPNSILNKFKNANLKKENESLKNKLMQMELLLAEKERLEKERIEKGNAQKKNSPKKQIE
jgi:hypothetical protein